MITATTAGSIPTHPEAGGWKNWADKRACHPVTARSTDAAAWSLVRHSHGVVHRRTYSCLPALLPTGDGTVHLTRIVGGKPNHGKRPRGTSASTEKFNFVYFVGDVGEQVPAYYTHVPRPLMHGHARPTHVHGQRMKNDLKALTQGDHQKLFRAGREKIRLESCSLQIVRKQWEA